MRVPQIGDVYSLKDEWFEIIDVDANQFRIPIVKTNKTYSSIADYKKEIDSQEKFYYRKVNSKTLHPNNQWRKTIDWDGSATFGFFQQCKLELTAEDRRGEFLAKNSGIL